MLVVAGDGWHRGVIGIVASKLVDAYHRPAIVLSIDGHTAHGSCRSIPSFNMLAGLESCAALLQRFGGHKVAAGLTLEAHQIKTLRLQVNDYADARLGPDDLRPRLRIDDRLGLPRDLGEGRAPTSPRWRRLVPVIRDRSVRPAWTSSMARAD